MLTQAGMSASETSEPGLPSYLRSLDAAVGRVSQLQANARDMILRLHGPHPKMEGPTTGNMADAKVRGIVGESVGQKIDELHRQLEELESLGSILFRGHA